MIIAALCGLIAAFLASMPVAGPVAALVVRHALEGRPRSALALSLGTGLAEGLYAFLALWGFSAILAEAPIIIPISKALAAVVLIGLGVWFTRFVPHTPQLAPAEVPHPHHATPPSLRVDEVMLKSQNGERTTHAFGVGFSVTVLNPTLLATWAAAATTIASMDLFPVEGAYAWPFAVGVVIGATAWFALLVGILSRYRHHFSPLTLQRVIRGMGYGLVALGLWFVVGFVRWLVLHA